MDFEVRHIDGTTVKLISSEHVSAITSATQTRKLCGNDTVTINLQSATYIEFRVGDTIKIFGTTYTMNQLPTVKKESERSYTYTLVFEGLQYTLIDRVFLMPANTQGDNLMFDLAGMLRELQTNINRGVLDENNNPINSAKPYEFVLDESLEETEYKNLSLTGKNCLQVLQQLCQEWNTEFVFAEEPTRIAIYIGVAGSTFAFPFKYGRGGGVYELNREKGASDICTRLFVYGGTQNLTYYRHNRLCLPSKEKNQSYVEDATAQAVYGIKEQVKNFDDIYPNRIGTITSLSGCDYNEFIDSAMADEEFGFDLNEKWANTEADCEEWLALKGLEDTAANRAIYQNDVAGTATKYLMAGATAKIHFNTGALAGYECDLHSYTHSSQKFVLKPLVDENGYDFPSKTNAAFKLAVGDEYVILDINLPTAYKEEAESKLATEAASYFDTVCRPQPKYTLTIEPIALKHIVGPSTADTEIFKVGDLINVSDPTGGVENATIRIDQFVRNLLDPFDYKLTLTDEITYSQQVRTLIEVDAIKRVVEESKINDVNRIRRGWKDAEELYNQMFDTEGHYYSEKIAPLSIDTQMLKVGARSQQLVLQNVLFQPNYNADPANLQISAGSLVHYTIAEPDIKTWTMSAYSGSNVPSTAQYVYAKCAKNGTTGTWLVTDQAIIFDSDPSYYHFLVGSLSSVDSVSNTRNFAATYGFTTINGRNITTGVIKSADGNGVIIDLDNNTITGNIKFLSGGQAVDAEQYIGDTVDDAVSEIEIGGRNLIPNTSEPTRIPASGTPTGNYAYVKFAIYGQPIKEGDIFTITANIDTSSLVGNEVTVSFYNDAVSTTYTGWVHLTVVNGKIEGRLTVNASGDNKTDAVLLIYSGKAGSTADSVITVSNLKLEKGTVATDWTPAPEDVPYNELVKTLTATCSTAAGTSTKVIVCPELTANMLTDPNLRIKVKFTNANTASTFEFEFRNSSSGAAIRPVSSASTNKVRLSYEGRTSSYHEVKCYWTEGQEVEFTYKGVETDGGGTSVHLKMTDETQFNTTMAFTKAMQGMTTIAGGLILTKMIQAGSGASQAGMNGVEDNAVAFWAGNTIGNAQTWNAPVVIMRGGDAKFGVLRIDGQSGLLTMEESNVPRFRIQGYGLPSAPSGQALERSNNATADYSENGYTTMPDWTNSMPSGGTISNSLKTGISNIHNGMLVIFKGTVTLTLSTALPYGTEVQLLFRGIEIANFITYGGLTYSVDLNTIRPRGYFSTSGSTGSISVLLACSVPISFTVSGLQYQWYHDAAQAVTVVGTDGMAVQINSTNYFQVQEKTSGNTKVLETTIKGNVDMPGVLWAGIVKYDGTLYNNAPMFACVDHTVAVTKESTGKYKLTLSGFSVAPAVLATCTYTDTSSLKGCSASVYGYQSNAVWIRTFKDNDLTDLEFHVVLFGKN